MLSTPSSRLKLVAPTGLALGGLALLIVIGFAFLPLDLDARRTQTLEASSPLDKSPHVCSVLLILHRILPDQNAIDVSLILTITDARAISAIETKRMSVSAFVSDAASAIPSLKYERLKIDAANYYSGDRFIAAQSDHFFLSTDASKAPYPFDDMSITPVITVLQQGNGAALPCRSHVQRALSGRLLKIGHDQKNRLFVATLTRPALQKFFVVTVALILWLLSLILTVKLYTNPVTDVTEFLAVAGFLVASVTFRDVLGFSRLAATGAAEVFAIGVPILFVSLGMAYSLLRQWRAERRYRK